MNREEVQLLGFEIVAFVGDARSKFLEALTAAQAGDFGKSRCTDRRRKQLHCGSA